MFDGKEQIARCQGIEKTNSKKRERPKPEKRKRRVGEGGEERDKGEGWKRERNKKARKYCQVRGIIIMMERKRRKTGSTSLLKQPAQLLQ